LSPHGETLNEEINAYIERRQLDHQHRGGGRTRRDRRGRGTQA
jgi:hypothetical protein